MLKVCKDSLRTKDRLQRWGNNVDDTSALCGAASENRDHLFFFFGFSRNVWSEVLRRNDQKHVRHNWAEELHEVINRCKGSSLAARVGRLVFSIAVYCK